MADVASFKFEDKYSTDDILDLLDTYKLCGGKVTWIALVIPSVEGKHIEFYSEEPVNLEDVESIWFRGAPCYLYERGADDCWYLDHGPQLTLTSTGLRLLKALDDIH